jgi:hypothetical protein
MKKLCLIVLLSTACGPFIAIGKVVNMDLSEAVKDKKVTMTAVNTEGMFTGKSTKLSIKNTSSDDLHLKVDLGIILQPVEPDFQPLVLAGEEMLVVQSSKEGEIMVNTFCGNGPLHCPNPNLQYFFSCVGSDTLAKVLRFIKNNSLYDHLGQKAVWAITNGYNIGSVYDPAREAISIQFQDLICKVTGRTKADYYTVSNFVERPAQPAYIPKPLMIIANFEILLDSPKTLTLGVFDSSGKMIQPVFENQFFPHAGHRFGVEFESADVPAGYYYIRLKEGEKILKEKKVLVD